MSEEKHSVVIVTEQRGKQVTERRYRADSWDADEYGRLTVSVKTAGSEMGVTSHRVVAEYSNPGAWLCVREGEADDPLPGDLLLARHALRRIWENVNGPHQDFTIVAKIIDETCDKIGWPE